MPKLLRGRIAQWDAHRGFGFIEREDRRGQVFLHFKDFKAKGVLPSVGDSVEFRLGLDPKGRECAMAAALLPGVTLKFPQDELAGTEIGRVKVWEMALLSGLLVAPGLACLNAKLPLHWVGLYVLGISTVSYRTYKADKRRAALKERRVPERRLHILELLGGWPGAYVAQRTLRHKIAKPPFKFWFWLIVAAYQFAAVDSLNDWKISRAAWDKGRTWISEMRVKV